MATNTAEDVNSSTSDASQDPTDAISDLLTAGDEVEEVPSDEESTEEDTEEVEEPTEESTDEVDEIEDAEVSWESVLGVDEGKLNFDDEGNLAGVNVKVDGESDSVKMNDLITGYQNNKAFTQKSQAFSEEKKQFDAYKVDAEQQFSTKLKDVITLGEYLEKQLVDEYSGVDWDRLRAEDPAEYAALRQDYSSRANDMNQFKATMKAEADKQQSDLSEKQKSNREAYNVEQHDKILVNNPAWADKKVFEKDLGDLKTFCSEEYGFTDNDFGFAKDSRVIELIKDANSYRKGMKIAQHKSRKPVPQFQKSRGVPSKKVTKLQKLTTAASKASGSAKRDLQTSAISELLGGQ